MNVLCVCHPLVGKKPLTPTEGPHSRLESQGHIREAVTQTPNELEWDSIAGCGTIRRHRALTTRCSCSCLSRRLSQGKQKWGSAWSQSPAPHGGVSPLPGLRSTLTANQLGTQRQPVPQTCVETFLTWVPSPQSRSLLPSRLTRAMFAPFKSQTFRKGHKSEMCSVE